MSAAHTDCTCARGGNADTCECRAVSAARASTSIEPNTLTIERSGAWMVTRPHATGCDFGPGRIARKGETIPDDDVQVQIDWYTRAGFRIVDKRKAAKGEA